MDEKNLEQQLEESADRIRTEAFSARWKRIRRRLPRENHAAGKRIAAIASAACGTAALLSLALCFGLLIPQAQRQEVQGLRYYEDTELTYVAHPADEFFRIMAETDFSVIDFARLGDSDNYFTAVADGTVLGGQVEFNNSDGGAEYLYSISFFSPQVILKESSYRDLNEELTVGGMTVRYETRDADGYESKALLTCRDVTYFIRYFSLNDDLQIFLERVFA